MNETKKCPYCAEEILLEAKKCKHCGEYLDESLRKEPAKQEITVKSKEGCFLQSLNLGCMIIFGVIVLLAIIIIVAGSQY